MKAISFSDELWISFSNEEIYWRYRLIGDWYYDGLWFYREGIMYRKDVKEIG